MDGHSLREDAAQELVIHCAVRPSASLHGSGHLEQCAGHVAPRRLYRGATIFVFSVVMLLAFTYSKSLWVPILTHSANDFLSFVIFRV